MNQPPPLPEVNPYAAPAARVIDPMQGDAQELADRATRFGAYIVDTLIFSAVAILFAVVAPMMARNGASQQTAAFVMLGIGGVAMLTLIVVNFVLLHKYGQTIAKRLFKIKIVRSDGSRCGLLRVIFIRSLPVGLLNAIPVVGYIFMLLDPLLIFREDYRCLHDHIADTVVVKV